MSVTKQNGYFSFHVQVHLKLDHNLQDVNKGPQTNKK